MQQLAYVDLQKCICDQRQECVKEGPLIVGLKARLYFAEKTRKSHFGLLSVWKSDLALTLTQLVSRHGT